jgi:hypothetical protein
VTRSGRGKLGVIEKDKRGLMFEVLRLTEPRSEPTGS